MKITKIKPNTQFGEWTTIEFLSCKETGSIAKWKCKCSCGEEKLVRSTDLLNNRSTKCKSCSNREHAKSKILPNNQAMKNIVASRIKRAGFDRGLEFNLTDEEVLKLSKQNCFYCDKPPCNIGRSSRGKELVYNGLDRVDNSIGYIKSNVVPCCKYCNMSKRDLPLEEWIENIKNIYSNYDKIIERSETIPNGSSDQVIAKRKTSQEDEDIVQSA